MEGRWIARRRQLYWPPRPYSLESLPNVVLKMITRHLFTLYDKDLSAGYRADEYHEEWYQTVTFHRFDLWREILDIACVSRRLYEQVSPTIYEMDILHNECSALLLSAKQGNIDGARRSLREGADVNQEDVTELQVEHNREDDYSSDYTRRSSIRVPNMTALHWAAWNRDKDMTHLLLRHRADVKLRPRVTVTREYDEHLCMSLGATLAPFYSKLDDLPFNAGLRLHDILRMGANPLYYALVNVQCPELSKETSALGVTEFLVQCPELSKETSALEVTELLVQCPELSKETSALEVTKLLVQYKADLTTHLAARLHALHQASSARDVETAEYLLQLPGADANVRDAYDNTPLHHVAKCMNGNEDDAKPIIDLLMRHGAKVDAVDAGGETPLQACFVLDRNINVAVRLIQAGAAPFPGIYRLPGRFPTEERATVAESLIAKGWTEETTPKTTASPAELRRKKDQTLNRWMHKLVTKNTWDGELDFHQKVPQGPEWDAIFSLHSYLDTPDDSSSSSSSNGSDSDTELDEPEDWESFWDTCY